MPVEFLADDADESPLELAPRRSPLVRVLAAVALVVAVLAWALTRSGGGVVTGAPHPTRPTPTRAGAPPVRAQLLACRTGAPVTDELASAMRHFLPSLKVANLRVYRCTRGSGVDGRVVFEAVSGHYHRVNIDVEATTRGVDEPSISPRLGADNGRFVVLTRIATLAAGLKVSVVAWGPPHAGIAVPGGAMARLADFVSLNVVL